jgi:hypothetical protein
LEIHWLDRSAKHGEPQAKETARHRDTPPSTSGIGKIIHAFSRDFSPPSGWRQRPCADLASLGRAPNISGRLAQCATSISDDAVYVLDCLFP